MSKQDSDQSRDDVIPTKNAFAGLAIDEPEIAVTDKTAQVADLSPKIKLASNIEEHRAVTALLKQRGEEFCVIPSPVDHPLKVVMKGLPSSTSIEDIKTDLTEQGVPVIKVAQMTQRKSKFPLPISMVKDRRLESDRTMCFNSHPNDSSVNLHFTLQPTAPMTWRKVSPSDTPPFYAEISTPTILTGAVITTTY
ncbi:hypothetical protein TNCV_4820551 [Trichonephila clavipes]|nr:hypothetical protein TNCV_4820551 [Trichonephila clavipes]